LFWILYAGGVLYKGLSGSDDISYGLIMLHHSNS
jgi:hypothetical protein